MSFPCSLYLIAVVTEGFGSSFPVAKALLTTPSACRHECAIPSPSWHRNLRKRRARDRSRIWAARRQGRPGPLLAALRLAGHHSQPKYRELVRMGGKKNADRPWKNNPGGDRYADHNAHRSWQYWSGARPSPKGKHGIPQRYDQVQLPGSASGDKTEETPCLMPFAFGSESAASTRDHGDLLRRQVQKALTTSKRCETKIRKLAETKETRQIQWRAWKAQMKSSFLKQQQQFEKDQVAIDDEIAVLRSQGEEAAQAMQQLVLHGPAAMDTEAPAPPPEAGAWEDFLGQSTSEPPAMDFMRQAYAFAQMAAQRHGQGMPAPPGQRGLGVMPPFMMEQMVGCPPAPPPSLPPGSAMDGIPHGGPGSGGHAVPRPVNPAAPPPADNAPTYATAETGQVRNGPYSRSPMAGGMHVEGRHPGSAAADTGNGPPGLVPPTAAPTDLSAGLPAPGPNVAAPELNPVPLPGGDGALASPLPQMLRTRRQEARRAMEPFGIAKESSDQQTRPDEAGRPPGSQANLDGAIIDDDQEEGDVMQALHASPGLGRLE